MILMMADKLLEKIRDLQFLSVESEQQLLAKVKLRRLKKNELLLREGQPCKHVYFVQSGCIKSVLNDDGKEVNLNFTLANGFITNLKSLRESSPSAYNIQACEPSVVWAFNKDNLFELYKQSEEISGFGRNLLEQLLVEQEDHANIFKLKNPAERYDHIMKNNPQLLQKISLTQLSSYLGISRETLSRIRKIK